MQPNDLEGLRSLYTWVKHLPGFFPDVEWGEVKDKLKAGVQKYPIFRRVQESLDLRHENSVVPTLERAYVMHLLIEQVVHDLPDRGYTELERYILGALHFQDMTFDDLTWKAVYGLPWKDYDGVGAEVEKALESLKAAGEVTSDARVWSLIPF